MVNGMQHKATYMIRVSMVDRLMEAHIDVIVLMTSKWLNVKNAQAENE